MTFGEHFCLFDQVFQILLPAGVVAVTNYQVALHSYPHINS